MPATLGQHQRADPVGNLGSLAKSTSAAITPHWRRSIYQSWNPRTSRLSVHMNLLCLLATHPMGALRWV